MESKDLHNNLTNLIVNYLPQDFRNGELYSMFITIGPIESHRVMINKQTGYSYGYGFVNYKYPEDAAKAIEKLNGLQVDNKKIKVAYALPCSRDELVDNNLYIRRLPRDITEEELQELFGQYGTITQKKLLKDCVTGLNRGVGFVRFSKRSEAQTAIEALHDKVPPGGTERLSVRVASDQKKQNMAFYAGFLESQKYVKGRVNFIQDNLSPTFKAPSSSSNKLLQQYDRQDTGSGGTRLTLPYSSHSSQNVAFRQRGPFITAHQHPVFPSPHQNNRNFSCRGVQTRFVKNLDHNTPIPSLVQPHLKSRLPISGRQSRFPVGLNPIDY